MELHRMNGPDQPTRASERARSNPASPLSPVSPAGPLSPSLPDEVGATLRTISSRELLGTGGIVRIEHAGELYVLRRTRNGRLILTK